MQALSKKYSQSFSNCIIVSTFVGNGKNNYTFALSKVATIDFCGFGESTYTKVFKELKEFGYLKETSKDKYDFYEIPKDDTEQQIIITINKADNGFSF